MAKTPAAAKARLSRAVVVEQAIALADRGGIAKLTMRSLAAHLGVEAMSLYNHVANKEQLLSGMVESVMMRVYVPAPARDWQSELRLRYLSARTVMLGHPWVAALIESCQSEAGQLAASNAVLGCLRAAGLPIHVAYRALLVLDSYLYGFVFQEVTWPFSRAEIPRAVQEMMPRVSGAELTHLAELMHYVSQASEGVKRGRGQHEYRAEFEFGLDLILNGLSRLRQPDGDAPLTETRSVGRKRK